MTQYPILAIDYGSKKVGLAISDVNGIIASPLKVIRLSTKYNFDSLVADLKTIITEYHVKSILLGDPIDYDKPEGGRAAKKVKLFMGYIAKRLDVPIQLYDESFSTITAQNMLLSTGQHTKETRKKIDMVASAVFLQEFLNSKQKDTNEISSN
jgi:putative Holliday junction resolvase